jgi:hypothetical protein
MTRGQQDALASDCQVMAKSPSLFVHCDILRHVDLGTISIDFSAWSSGMLRAMFEEISEEISEEILFGVWSPRCSKSISIRDSFVSTQDFFSQTTLDLLICCVHHRNWLCHVVPLLGQVLQRTYLRNMLSPWNESRLIGALKGGKQPRTSR